MGTVRARERVCARAGGRCSTQVSRASITACWMLNQGRQREGGSPIQLAEDLIGRTLKLETGGYVESI